MDAAVNHLVHFQESSRFVAADAFCFEDEKEIFRHCIVVRAPASWHRRRNAVLFSQPKICLGCVWKALVAVELQLRGDLFFLCALPGGWCPVPGLPFAVCGLAGRNAVVIQIPGHGQTDIICSVWFEYRKYRSPICGSVLLGEILVEKILVLVQQLPHYSIEEPGRTAYNFARMPASEAVEQLEKADIVFSDRELPLPEGVEKIRSWMERRFWRCCMPNWGFCFPVCSDASG